MTEIEIITANIRNRRLEMGLTSQALGDKMNLTRTRIGAIEKAKDIKVSTLLRLGKALEVDITYFFIKHENY